MSCISLLVYILLEIVFNPVKYHIRWFTGICINTIFIGLGAWLVCTHEVQQQQNWIGNAQNFSDPVLVTLSGPVTEKEKSFKTTASIEAILINGQWQTASGNIFVYFKKDSAANHLHEGSELVAHAPLQPITNTGNPGGFDYRRYCAFQGIHHQVFLQPKDYQLTGKNNPNAFKGLLFNGSNHVLSLLKKYIPGARESGVAEALLIGYRNDLDKDLVQSYSNTGVVHIIAISGLHLGMIYGLLVLLFRPLSKTKHGRWLSPVLILVVLWAFTLLTGAAASILRSAVMFSFIVIGDSIGRKTNIYNTLAASAFCLLLYNPYFLWDVGFQLSYAAVLGIVMFVKPVYKWFYIENKLLRGIWQLNAVTLAAQTLTIPLVLFYFHQFPNLFLCANFVAVPLSGLILYAELVLLVCAGIPKLNETIGQIVSFSIRQMNAYIERCSSLPFSVTDNINISFTQAIILYLLTAAMAIWLLRKKTNAFCIALGFFTLFLFLQCLNQVDIHRRQKLIVYNIPKQSVIDIIEGNRFRFMGNTGSLEGTIYSFYLRPARIALGVRAGILKSIFIGDGFIVSRRKKVLVIDHWPIAGEAGRKITVDMIVFSGNPGVKMAEVAQTFNCKQYVFDSSNPLWKIQYWKKDADSLHLRHHSTPEQGAFEADL